MKTFKLLIAGLVISCFFLTTNVRAQGMGNSDPVEYGFYSFYCLCAGEVLAGEMYWREFDNKNSYHSNMTVFFEGQTTGDLYKVTEIFKNNIDPNGISDYSNMVRSFKVSKHGKLVTLVHFVLKDGEWKVNNFECK